jgi:hypothetical protein
MSYETGSATDEHDLLDKLRIFLVAAGWTQNYWAAEGAGYRLHLNKGNVYANFRSATNERIITSSQYAVVKGIGFNLSTSYNASLGWSLQPNAITYHYGGSNCNVLNISASVLSYYFFANGNNFHVIAEKSADYFVSMHGGELTQFGSITGNLFLTANACALASYEETAPAFARGSDINYTTHVYADSKWWNGDTTYGGSGNSLIYPFGANNIGTYYYRFYLSYGGHVSELLAAAPSSAGSTVLLPLYFSGYQNPYNWPFGYIADARICRSEYIYNGKEVIIGADTWKMFKTRSIYYASNNKIEIPLAIAIKKVT